MTKTKTQKSIINNPKSISSIFTPSTTLMVKNYESSRISFTRLNFSRNFGGFTIVELLIVIVIIAILAAITIVSYTGITQKANNSSSQAELSNSARKLKLYQLDNDNYPSDKATAVSAKLIPYSTDDNEYIYHVDNSSNPQTFCVTRIKNNVAYSVNQNGKPVLAPFCPMRFFDAGNTESYPGSGTTWYDLSGNVKNGSMVGGIGYSTDGGGALNFDGTDDAVNSYKINNISTSRISISAWIKPSTISGHREISNQGQYDSGPWTGWRFRQTNNYIYFKLGDNSLTTYACSGGSMEVDNWYFVAGVWDGSYIRIYVNGAEAGSCAKSFIYINNETTHAIGRYAGGGYYFSGLISSVGIYDKALSAPDVLNSFNTYRSRYGL